MSNDRTAIEAIKKHPYRKAFVAGFIRALWSRNDISVIPKAAWALAELWAIEAIPSLRAQIARWLPTETRQACKQALDKLEMISRLPRAISPSEIDTLTLPRPASATDFHAENLPSPAHIDELNPLETGEG
jgi:ABC-type phosphate/phosphonate transport system substrate-binding protein